MTSRKLLARPLMVMDILLRKYGFVPGLFLPLVLQASLTCGLAGWGDPEIGL